VVDEIVRGLQKKERGVEKAGMGEMGEGGRAVVRVGGVVRTEAKYGGGNVWVKGRKDEWNFLGGLSIGTGDQGFLTQPGALKAKAIQTDMDEEKEVKTATDSGWCSCRRKYTGLQSSKKKPR